MKILVEYNKGIIEDYESSLSYPWAGLEKNEFIEPELTNTAVDADVLIEMRKAGFDTDEIITLHRKGII